MFVINLARLRWADAALSARLTTIQGLACAAAASPALAAGVNTYRGAVTYPAVAEALGLDYAPFSAKAERTNGGDAP